MKVNFSVLIPVYYKENSLFFDHCMESMYLQTVQPTEIVVIKDGKLTEELDQVIEKWSISFKEKLRIISLPENIGMSLALNEALDSCHEWIARMDSDDIASAERFEKQLKYIEQNPQVDVFSSWIEEYDDEMKNFIAVREVPTSHAAIIKFATLRNPINHMAAMFRKECAIQVGGYPSGFSTSDDYAFWVHMIQKGYTFGNISESLVKARTGKGFLERRMGINYLKYEIAFLKHLKKIGFYSNYYFLINFLARSTARLLPSKMLFLLYKKIRKIR